MNISKIKKFITENKGEVFTFKFKGARNQIDEFTGRIVASYPAVFTVRVLDHTNRIKSYSYNDVLINNLEMKTIILEK